MNKYSERGMLVENEKPELDLLTLPLISKYRVLVFFGTSDGDELNLGFNINDLIGRSVVIKSIRLVPYARENVEDFFVNDGVVSNTETIQARQRLTRVIDDFTASTIIDFLINGVPIGIFPSTGDGGYPADLHLDNIYYWYREKVQTFTVAVNSNVYTGLESGSLGTGGFFIKVVVEVYILS